MEITVTYTLHITEAIKEDARANGTKAIVQSEKHEAQLRAAQQRRRERERQARQRAEI